MTDGGRAAQVPGATYLTRVLRLLTALATAPRTLSLAELAEVAELSRPTAHRMLTTLESVGLAARTPSKTYEVGTALLQLCAAGLPRVEVRRIAYPYMQKLARETGETVVLSVPIDDEYLYLDCVESVHDVRQTAVLGARTPLVRGASGTAILAGLSPQEAEVVLRRSVYEWPVPRTRALDAELLRTELAGYRAAGYAWSMGERASHSFAVATAIMGREGRPIGSLAVSGPGERFNRESSRAAVELLKAATAELSAAARHLGQPFQPMDEAEALARARSDEPSAPVSGR